jgi:hypothetical protein
VKLFLGDLDLATVARHIQIIGQASVYEPADAPQRERRTVKVRLEFREDSYLANAQRMEQVRTALRTPRTPLRWEDDSGAKYVERWVTITESDQGEDSAWGTHTQSLTFSFYYYVHTLTTNCLPATMQRLPDGAAHDLGAVIKWSEQIAMDHFHDQRDPRRRVMANLAIGGRFQGNTTATLEATRTALLAVKDALVTDLVAGVAFRLQYGTFDAVVRVTRFSAEVDQANGFIEWSLQATFTKTPAEDDYAWLDWELYSRETKSEGIVSLGLRGRVGASSRIKALAALNALSSGPGSLIPAGYVQLTDQVTDHQVQSADGTAYLELIFDREWRDTTSQPITVKKPGAGALLDLHIVERFADRQQSELFDPMRPHRKRAGGVATFAGKIYAADTLTAAQKETFLLARKAALDAVLAQNAQVEVKYGAAGAVFNRTVRVVDWDCVVGRLKNCLEWSLQCQYTRYPNEQDYAVCEFRTGTRENAVEGTVQFLLTGRIGAPTEAAAFGKLARLRTAVVPAGYVRLSADPVANQVSLESNLGTGANQGDGDTFIQLDFNEEYQKTTGDVLTWTLKTTHQDDVRTGMIQTTYSGTVSAKGNTRDAAWLVAALKAEELGANKYPFLVRSTVTENDKLFQTSGGTFFVSVEFNYEYQRKGARTYLEVTAELSKDAFGQNTEVITGYVAAPDLATAQAAYLADVRTLPAYAERLLLSERTPTKSAQIIRGVGEQFDRYAFSLTVFTAKAPGESALEYSITSQTNLQTLEHTSVVAGQVFAANETLAGQFLDAYLATLELGVRTGQPMRKTAFRHGAAVTGSAPVTAFTGLEFSETYVKPLTGMDGILECEVTEQLRYSGNRVVEKPIPGGISLFQITGITPGQRVVTGRVRATTETACLTWAQKCRALLLTAAATYEEAPQVTTTFKFLPQTDGTARGDGANVVCFECSFQFQEWLAEHPLT